MVGVLGRGAVRYAGRQKIKAGNKAMWQAGAVITLLLGVRAIVLQILELLFLPFWPGSSGFSSLFTGFYPVFVAVALAGNSLIGTPGAPAALLPVIFLLAPPPTHSQAVSASTLPPAPVRRAT